MVLRSLPVTKSGTRMFMASSCQISPMLTCSGSSHMFISVDTTIWLFTVTCVSCTRREGCKPGGRGGGGRTRKAAAGR